MIKKILVFGLSGIFLLNISGCIALLAGGAAGAGTAVWLSGKLSQQFNASYERTVKAAESALKSLNYDISKVTREYDITQLKSEYADGSQIWVDVKRISEMSSRVEVRVGGVNSNKQAANEILKRIQQYI